MLREIPYLALVSKISSEIPLKFTLSHANPPKVIHEGMFKKLPSKD